MAQMLAPLMLNSADLDPDATGGGAPFSGGVAQTINPWSWMARVVGNQFSFFTVNLGRSSAPEVEADILQNVGSYGRQLGRLSDVVELLANRLPRDELTEDERIALDDFAAQMREIRRIKARRGR